MLFQEWDMERALEVRAQEAMEKGMKEGMKVGMEEGMKVGMEEGIKVGMKMMHREVVRAMAEKLNPEEIADLTKIELDQVQAILNMPEDQNRFQ